MPVIGSVIESCLPAAFRNHACWSDGAQNGRLNIPQHRRDKFHLADIVGDSISALKLRAEAQMKAVQTTVGG